jgi:hypothetical protein
MIELRDNYWAVEAPEGAKYHRIDGVPNGAFYELIFYKDSEDIDFPEEIEEIKIVDLPPGSWQIVCTSKDATAEQIKEVIERNGDGWIDYDKDRFHNDILFPDPMDSFKSMLQAKGCDLNKTYLILKKQ